MRERPKRVVQKPDRFGRLLSVVNKDHLIREMDAFSESDQENVEQNSSTERYVRNPDRFGRRLSLLNKDHLIRDLDAPSESENVEENNNGLPSNNTHNNEHISIEYVDLDDSHEFRGITLVTESQKDPPTNDFHKLVLERLSEILVRIDVLEKQQIDKIVERRLQSTDAVIRTTELEKRGLPARSKETVDNLEFDLSKSEVMQSMVSHVLF